MISLSSSRPAIWTCFVGSLLAAFMAGSGVALGAELAASGLIPRQMVLPAPWWVLKVLLICTFWIHLILINIVIGLTVLATVKAWRTEPGVEYPMKRDITIVPSILALAVNFGVAPFLFIQLAYGSFIYSSSVIMAVWWISVPVLVIFCYYALYLAKSGQPYSLNARRFFLTTVTILLFTIAFILTNNTSMMLRPDHWFEWFAKPGGTVLNWKEPTLIPRYLHMLTASVAIGALFMAARARWNIRSGKGDKNEEEKSVSRGLHWFFWASLVQAALGILFLFLLPSGVFWLFLGKDMLATSALGLAILGLIGALVMSWSKRVALCAAFTAGTVFIMICIRDMVRVAMLAPFITGSQGDAPVYGHLTPKLPLPLVNGQTGALLLFLVCTLIAVGLIIWMVRVALRAFGNSPPNLPQAAHNSIKGLGE